MSKLYDAVLFLKCIVCNETHGDLANTSLQRKKKL